ncbi:hypothetical protein HMPREF0501_00268 [Limosilactobacillus coleohominis 101-4-CHN]|uniref:YolD-like protein n=1 Tax=Limosilactobacillus coleohominis 101-4-CHN TaxID=575594 RepID=C7XUA2_9LACO|nr:hypothetical protein [Limosilactobacillus coleohominis]EEU30863.1 hypothetical protein HMPREF0501_00268 [Limosilactobacillus coleohominis 101-4-CHN]
MDHEKDIIEHHLFSDTSRYQDIMDLPRHQSKAHLPMSQHDRAGQFAPFSALTGYHHLIDQTAQHYKNKQYQTRQQALEIRQSLNKLSKQSPVEVNYFNAESGFYETIKTHLMQINWLAGTATFIDHQNPQQQYQIPLANIRAVRNLPQS